MNRTQYMNTEGLNKLGGVRGIGSGMVTDWLREVMNN